MTRQEKPVSPMMGSLDTMISAPAEDVYELVSTVTRMGEWSPVCRSCEWENGAQAPTMGARFVGHNRQDEREWSTTCQVISAEPGREFAFATLVPESDQPLWRTVWRYSFTPEDGGTRLTESFEVVNPPPAAAGMSEEAHAARRADVLENVRSTLERIKQVAEK